MVFATRLALDWPEIQKAARRFDLTSPPMGEVVGTVWSVMDSRSQSEDKPFLPADVVVTLKFT